MSVRVTDEISVEGSLAPRHMDLRIAFLLFKKRGQYLNLRLN